MQVISGHGGLLNRFDGLIVIPVGTFILYVMKSSVVILGSTDLLEFQLISTLEE